MYNNDSKHIYKVINIDNYHSKMAKTLSSSYFQKKIIIITFKIKDIYQPIMLNLNEIDKTYLYHICLDNIV